MNFGLNWYQEIPNTEPVSQGDIFKRVPIFVPDTDEIDFSTIDFSDPESIQKANGFVKIDADIIVLSQACDLAIREGQFAPKLENVVVAGIQDTRQVNNGKGMGRGPMSEISKLNRPNLFFLKGAPQTSTIEFNPHIVHFDFLYTLQWKMLDSFRQRVGMRLRLEAPYREQLSYHFGNYFSRVGIPENIDDYIRGLFGH